MKSPKHQVVHVNIGLLSPRLEPSCFPPAGGAGVPYLNFFFLVAGSPSCLNYVLEKALTRSFYNTSNTT